MRLRTQPRMNVYSIMSATKYAAEICYYNGKEVFATQLAVVEYHYVIFIQRIANSIAQSLSVVLDYLFGLLLDFPPFSALFHRLIVISSPSPFNRAFASLLYLYIRIYLL